VTNLKALGIYLDPVLSWDRQAEHATSKTKKLTSAFKFLRKYFDEEQFLKIASAYYYGTVFFYCTVWFEKMKAKFKMKMQTINFRMLRVASQDRKKRADKGRSSMRCKCATPVHWVNCLTASWRIKILRDQQSHTYLYKGLIENCYTEQRKPGLAFFINGAKKRAGEQRIQNHLLMMKDITRPWHENNLNNDKIRIEMK